ncbi:hypothetical protein [Nocardiopsis sp. NPDC057823]|uniref:hypothetical protein n=1 Tax=Nocardiopsis sp. NPDC057823 TaxID=3346256 RepID=UPI00366D99CB
MIPTIIGVVVCSALTGTAVHLVHARRADEAEIGDFHARREVIRLREVNARLSVRCGHCGTSRALPAPARTER